MRHALAKILAGICVTAGAMATSVSFAAPAFAGPSGDLAAATNSARAAAGLPALQLDSSLSAVAQSWANHLAATNVLAHNPGLRSQVTNWSVLGENVGMAGDVPSVQQAFMNSAPHRANILDSRYTQMGVGSATSTYPQCGCTVLWVVVDFRRPVTTAAPAPPPPATKPPAPQPTATKTAATKPAPAPTHKVVAPTPAKTTAVTKPATPSTSGAPTQAAQPAQPKQPTQGTPGTPGTPATQPSPSAPSTPSASPTQQQATALSTQLAAAATSPTAAATVSGDPVARLLGFASLMSTLPG